MRALAICALLLCGGAAHAGAQRKRERLRVPATGGIASISTAAPAIAPLTAEAPPPRCCHTARPSASFVRFVKVGAGIGGVAGLVEGIRVARGRCDNCGLAEPASGFLRGIAPLLFTVGGAGAGGVLGAGAYGGYRLARRIAGR